MKLEPGKCSYTLPPLSKVISVVIDDPDPARSGIVMMMTAMELRDLVLMRNSTHTPGKEDTRGLPRYYAIAPTADRLEIYPPPVTGYTCRIRYYPPIQEI